MSKIKVSTLSGPLLDYWVAKAEKLEGIELGRDGKFHGSICQVDGGGNEDWYFYSPSTVWSQGGTILEKNEISVACYRFPSGNEWWASSPYTKVFRGKSCLEAAMRAFVASKLGEEVSDE